MDECIHIDTFFKEMDRELSRSRSLTLPFEKLCVCSFLSKLSEVLTVNCLINVITFAPSLRLCHSYQAARLEHFILGRGRGIRPPVNWRQSA